FPVLVIGIPLDVAVLLVGTWWGPLKKVVRHAPPKPRTETAAYRWSRIIQRRPLVFALGAAALLIVLAIPTGNLRLGFSDESNLDEDTTTHRAYTLLSEGFGPGFNGTMLLVADLP